MSAPLAATPSAQFENFTAGLFRVEVDLTPGSTPTWSELILLTSYGPKYAQTTEDNTTLGDGGWASKFPTGNAFTAAVKGLVGGVNGQVNEAIQFVLDTGKQIGNPGTIHVRHWRTDTLDEKAEYWATCQATIDEAKPPKLQEWTATFEGRGKPITDFVVPTDAPEFAVGVGAATAGTITLIYGSHETGAINWNASAAAVKTALVALDDGFDATDWDVTGTAPNWVVKTPGGVLKAGTPVGLTGGTLTVAPQ